MPRDRTTTPQSAFILARKNFPILLSVLAEDGYEVIGPVQRDGAIIYDTIQSHEELPIGWTDEQEAGQYRLEKRTDKMLFGFAVGPHSWKQFLHPPERTLWRATRRNDLVEIKEEPRDKKKRAFLGVRACEIAAIDIHSQVFLNGPYKNADYEARRDNALIIAVNCSTPAKTCFCTSMETGPAVTTGHDIVMTELLNLERHDFVIEAASALGRSIVERLPVRAATAADLEEARGVSDHAANSIGRSLDTVGLKEFLQDNPDHPQWDDVAERCLSCTNCTAVCPTCFCTTIEDHTDLTGAEAVRVERQDSCFSNAFSELSGGPVRRTTKARYRQWMTHKLSTWIDQFGTSGCVGCGRCVAWCPAGIDITAEARAMRAHAEEKT